MSTDDAMREAQVIPDDIRELLERRSTFQEWLERLADVGSEFRAEVAEKVRSDYTERLSRVEAELDGHRAELEAALRERRSAVADVSERHDTRSAELEETELRYRVGEYDDGQWEQQRASQQAALDELAADLAVHSAAVAALEAVLDELAGRTPAGAAPPEPTSGDARSTGPEDAAAVDVLAAEPPAPAAPEPTEPVLEDAEPAPDSEPSPAWMTQQPAGAEREAVVEPEGEAIEEAEWTAAAFEAEAPALEAEPEEDHLAKVEREDTETLEEPLPEATEEPQEAAEFMDELEFLESLSLDDTDSFDAVSAMLDEEEEDGSESDRKGEDL